MILLAFLDEAGDLGFDFENKSPSTHFCITLLLCKNKKTFLNIRSAVKKTLSRKLFSKKSKRKIQELKGYETDLNIKKYFYTQLLQTKPNEQLFELYSVVIDKKKMLPFIENTKNKNHLYNIIARNVLELIDFSDVNEQVILYTDRCKGSKEQRIFNKYISEHLALKLPINIPLDIKHEVSHELTGLQAVDLFCYGIIRKYSDNDTAWYNCFSNKVIKEVLWEPKF